MTTTKPADLPAAAHRWLDDLILAGGAPQPLVRRVEDWGGQTSYMLEVDIDDLDGWIAVSDDSARPVLTRHVWIGAVGWRVWVGHVAGLPATLWAADPHACREQDPQPHLSTPHRPSPRPRVQAGEA